MSFAPTYVPVGKIPRDLELPQGPPGEMARIIEDALKALLTEEKLYLDAMKLYAKAHDSPWFQRIQKWDHAALGPAEIDELADKAMTWDFPVGLSYVRDQLGQRDIQLIRFYVDMLLPHMIREGVQTEFLRIPLSNLWKEDGGLSNGLLRGH